MKNAMIAIALLFSVSLAAQGGPHGRHGKKMAQTELSAEQQATLQSKRMALHLDLNLKQQEAVEKILIGQIRSRREVQAERRALKDTAAVSDPQQRFEQMNAHLEQKIAFQNQLKDILSEEQYSMWKHDLRQKHSRKGHRGSRR